MDLNSKWIRFKSFIFECVRVLKVTKKPDKEELKTIVKISGLGMLLIGLIGFLITLVKQLFFP
ncbi:MAG: protein translocase SEC61 complex subunit gamma [Nanoarchaeota archaeon]